MVAVMLLSISILAPTTTAHAAKGGFGFTLRIGDNQGRDYSSNVEKTDSAGYGAATTSYNDLVWSDKVYYRIHRKNWLNSRIAATSYYQVTGNSTINMWYFAGQAINGNNYQLEGDTDVYDAVVSGIWEP